MRWRNNSFNFWKSKQTRRNTQRYQISVALLLLIMMIIVSGCADGGAALNGSRDDLDIVDLGESNAMKNESAEQKNVTPKIDQNVPERLETATLALG